MRVTRGFSQSTASAAAITLHPTAAQKTGAQEPDAAISQAIKPGDTLTVALLWEAMGDPGLPYTVFTQLLDGDGKLVAQHDGPPAGGTSPTNGWLKGDRVADEHRIETPKTLPPGDYTLIVGLYDASGQFFSSQGSSPSGTVWSWE